MKANFTRRQFLMSAALPALAATGVLRAQSAWPATTRLLVPFVAGGGVDINMRKIAEIFGKALGTNMVVDNRAGAGGLLAVRQVATSPADGSNILVLSAGMLTLQAMGVKLDLLTDLTPVARTTWSPHLLVVTAKSPYNTLADLVAAAQARPGKLAYGTGGVGSNTHLIFETFRERVKGGFEALHVPYKSVASSSLAMMTGEVDFSFQTPAAVMSYLKRGDMRALAHSGARRLAIMPDVAPIADLGYPGYINAPWGGFALPANARPELVARLFQAIRTTYANPEVVNYFNSVGSDIRLSASPEALAAELRAELGPEQSLVRRLNLKPET